VFSLPVERTTKVELKKTDKDQDRIKGNGMKINTRKTTPSIHHPSIHPFIRKRVRFICQSSISSFHAELEKKKKKGEEKKGWLNNRQEPEGKEEQKTKTKINSCLDRKCQIERREPAKVDITFAKRFG